MNTFSCRSDFFRTAPCAKEEKYSLGKIEPEEELAPVQAFQSAVARLNELVPPDDFADHDCHLSPDDDCSVCSDMLWEKTDLAIDEWKLSL